MMTRLAFTLVVLTALACSKRIGDPCAGDQECGELRCADDKTCETSEKIDDMRFEAVDKQATLAGWQEFLKSYPGSRHADKARRNFEALQAEQDFAGATKTNTVRAYDSFLKAHPAGPQAEGIKRKIQDGFPSFRTGQVLAIPKIPEHWGKGKVVIKRGEKPGTCMTKIDGAGSGRKKPVGPCVWNRLKLAQE